jgi:hypothetical protein
MIVEVIRIVDRSAAYYRRSAEDRAIHADEWERRFDAGQRVKERARGEVRFQQPAPGTGQALPCEAGVGGGKVVVFWRKRHG